MIFDPILRAIENWQHWEFLLQVNVFVSIVLVLVQIKTTEVYEKLRDCTHYLWGSIRRNSLFATLLVLCWAVIYGYDRGWQPWPPFVILMICLNVHIVSRIVIMRQDIERMRGSHMTLVPAKDMA